MFRNWRDMVNAGIVRKKRLRPFRAHILMTKALKRMKVNFREYVCFYNEHGQLQYLDLVIKRKRGLAVILWKRKISNLRESRPHQRGRRSGLHVRERINRERKLAHLNKKGIPFTWMEQEHTSDEFMIKVSRWLKTLD